MKTEWLLPGINTLLLSLGLAVWSVDCASAQGTYIYCARVHSGSTTIWDAPFWWISAGGSEYSVSTFISSAPGTPPSRGSYMHTLQAMSPGEGFGVVCTACSGGPGSVYEVAVTQPNYFICTDTIVGVCSTNCFIGGLSGGAGYPTNTTAFQAANSVNKWGFVCWLTNTTGVPNPEIEFHYVSGTDPGNSLRQYADCVRFILLSPSGALAPAQIVGVGGSSVGYSGGAGTRFVLLKAPSLGTAPGSWERLATNTATPGLFTVPDMGAGASAFYRILSE